MYSFAYKQTHKSSIPTFALNGHGTRVDLLCNCSTVWNLLQMHNTQNARDAWTCFPVRRNMTITCLPCTDAQIKSGQVGTATINEWISCCSPARNCWCKFSTRGCVFEWLTTPLQPGRALTEVQTNRYTQDARRRSYCAAAAARVRHWGGPALHAQPILEHDGRDTSRGDERLLC